MLLIANFAAPADGFLHLVHVCVHYFFLREDSMIAYRLEPFGRACGCGLAISPSAEISFEKRLFWQGFHADLDVPNLLCP